jgi:hypothetical protein
VERVGVGGGARGGAGVGEGEGGGGKQGVEWGCKAVGDATPKGVGHTPPRAHQGVSLLMQDPTP